MAASLPGLFCQDENGLGGVVKEVSCGEDKLQGHHAVGLRSPPQPPRGKEPLAAGECDGRCWSGFSVPDEECETKA